MMSRRIKHCFCSGFSRDYDFVWVYLGRWRPSWLECCCYEHKSGERSQQLGVIAAFILRHNTEEEMSHCHGEDRGHESLCALSDFRRRLSDRRFVTQLHSSTSHSHKLRRPFKPMDLQKTKTAYLSTFTTLS